MRIPDMPGIQMVELGPVFEWSRLAETIFEKNYFYIKWSRLVDSLKQDYFVRFSNGPLAFYKLRKKIIYKMI